MIKLMQSVKIRHHYIRQVNFYKKGKNKREIVYSIILLNYSLEYMKIVNTKL